MANRFSFLDSSNILQVLCLIFNCSRTVRGPGIEDKLSKTALLAKNWPQLKVGGVLFTLVKQKVLVHGSNFYDD